MSILLRTRAISSAHTWGVAKGMVALMACTLVMPATASAQTSFTSLPIPEQWGDACRSARTALNRETASTTNAHFRVNGIINSARARIGLEHQRNIALVDNYLQREKDKLNRDASPEGIMVRINYGGLKQQEVSDAQYILETAMQTYRTEMKRHHERYVSAVKKNLNDFNQRTLVSFERTASGTLSAYAEAIKRLNTANARIGEACNRSPRSDSVLESANTYIAGARTYLVNMLTSHASSSERDFRIIIRAFFENRKTPVSVYNSAASTSTQKFVDAIQRQPSYFAVNWVPHYTPADVRDSASEKDIKDYERLEASLKARYESYRAWYDQAIKRFRGSLAEAHIPINILTALLTGVFTHVEIGHAHTPRFRPEELVSAFYKVHQRRILAQKEKIEKLPPHLQQLASVILARRLGSLEPVEYWVGDNKYNLLRTEEALGAVRDIGARYAAGKMSDNLAKRQLGDIERIANEVGSNFFGRVGRAAAEILGEIKENKLNEPTDTTGPEDGDHNTLNDNNRSLAPNWKPINMDFHLW